MKIKIILSLLITFSLSVMGQTKKELEVKNFFWGEHDTHKNTVEIPDKWKSESAVILYKNQNYDFHKFGKNVTYKNSTRKRIKLLDNSAVKEFSEFSFLDIFRAPTKVIVFPIPVAFNWQQNTGNFVGIKVVKPNGDEIEIDIKKESVQVDGKTNIAIPNLEVGDIIDYYTYYEDSFKSTFAYGFEPVETTLSEEYPIVNFKLFFETENDFFINFNSYNKAPELKQLPTEKRSIRRYSLEGTNIDKYISNRWFFPLLDLPSYKFQVYFARSGSFEDRALAFLPEKETIIKKNVSEEEVLDLYDKRLRANRDIGDLRDFFKSKTFKNDTEKVKEAYYFMRHAYLTQYIEAMVVKEADILYNPFEFYGSNPPFISSQKEFIKYFTAFLNRNDIDYDVVVSKKRYDGTIDDLLIEKNVDLLLKVNTETPLYVEYFDQYNSINEFNPLIENTEAYLLTSSKNKIDGITREKLPHSVYSQNEEKKEITFTLNDDFSGFSITSISNFKGHQKKEEQNNRLLFTDYIYDDYKKYETKSFIELVKRKKKKIEYQKQLDAAILKIQNHHKEQMKEAAQSEFELNEIDDYAFKINETGRYGFDSYLTFTESFKGKDAFIKKAGPNYIVEIGKLITNQIDLNKKQRERTENIHMSYPRIYNNKITFNIPKGYAVTGIDKLNKSIDNSTGAFISQAEVIGSDLIITTSKQYKNYSEPNSNWSLMVDFLDSANQFVNEKILLKKT
ncbi:DUF3857 domain-containing protein [Tamlana haliotis]|uniref:DUF3857 domain-containing protein n=1 Tax=Pseudotamlana haliotis TaxID=2614804 RepID=A0A6N6MFU7_9FLAO|nr:DUF3857 domain-containing protein [Tamlana haliotis]KAB1068678.1 DUF3857 domain-containing protein [Tamlana haliotis]